jgi:hypothetical protein
MCMVDDGEPFVKSSTTRPKARKATRCDECERDIAVGEQYERVDGLIHRDGWMVARMCMHCRAAAEWLVKVCDGYPLGAVLMDLKEHAIEYRDDWLAKQCDAIRAKWRADDGALMPLPVVPADLSRFGVAIHA